MVHEAVVIRLGEGGSLLADVASLFGGCRDGPGQNNLRLGRWVRTQLARAKALGSPDSTSARTMSTRLEPSSKRMRASPVLDASSTR